MTNQLSAYKKSGIEAQVLGSGPLEITNLLLNKMVEKITDALEIATQFGKEQELKSYEKIEIISKFSAAIQHACEINQTLIDNLNFKSDPELADELRKLYLFIQAQLMSSIEDQNQEKINQALVIANGISQTWKKNTGLKEE